MYTVNIVYTFDIIRGTKEMVEMLMENATDVRKEWNSVVDSVVHDKPKLIKRTRDRLIMNIRFTVRRQTEKGIFPMCLRHC